MSQANDPKLNLVRALQEHADTVEALAVEASAMAADAERVGELGFADALREMVHHHRATAIQFRARCEALKTAPSQGSG